MPNDARDSARRTAPLVDAGAWIAAAGMLLGLAVIGAWGILFDAGRGVSDDRPIGLIPRLLARGRG